jgi:oxepin-CoA hydrolase / 3-oxo-5,6-dehydrosuberyl-CoA semialdehyde dehydrogenase
VYQEQEIQKFFLEGVPASLEKLTVDTLPLWGSMDAKQMLVHLLQSTKMLHFKGEMQLRIPANKTEKAIAFLYTEKPIQKGVQVPLDIGYNLSNGSEHELSQLKTDLLEAITQMLHYFQAHPEHQSMHPFFGILNTEQWPLFQRKHFQHHLEQFGIKQ